MNRPSLEVADVVRQYGAAYLSRYGSPCPRSSTAPSGRSLSVGLRPWGGTRRSVTSVATLRLPLTPVAIDIAPSVQAGHKRPGSRPAQWSCSTSPTSMWCLLSRIPSAHSRSKTRG